MADKTSHSNSSKLNPTAQIFTPTNANSLTATPDAPEEKKKTLKPPKDRKIRCPLCYDGFFCPICSTEEDEEPASAATTAKSEMVVADFPRTPGHEREAAFKAMALAAEELAKNRGSNWLAVKRRIDAWLRGVEECEDE